VRTQLNFCIRVRVPNIDSDRKSAELKQREVMAILRSAFSGAVRGGARDVTMWDDYGHLLAHWDADSAEPQSIAKSFRKPLGK